VAGVGVQAKMQFAPGLARAGAMFLDQPLAWPTQLQARAVHQQVLNRMLELGRPKYVRIA
jgi:hypothetical protein